MRILVIILLSVFVSVADAAVWETIPNTQLTTSPAIYNWSPNPTPGTYGGITAWSGAAWDSTNNRLLLNGGGHSDYGGNEIYGFDFDTNTWSRLSTPENYADLDSSACVYGIYTVNGLPKAVHTYDGLFYDSVRNSLDIIGNGSGYSASCNGNLGARSYDFDTNAWNTITTAILPNGHTAGHGGAHDEATGTFWYTGYYLIKYDISAQTWEVGAGDNIFADTTNNTTVIDQANGFLVAQQGNSLYALPMVDFVAGSTMMKNYPITPTGTGPSGSKSLFGYAYDPNSESIVVWNGTSTIYFLKYNSLTTSWAWTSEETTGTLPTAILSDSDTPFGRFQYIPSLGKFAFIKSVYSDVYLLDIGNQAPITITTFNLTSAITDAETPFTTAVGFAKGDFPNGIPPTLNLSNYQVEVKKLWNDGSVKHSIFSGNYNSTAATPTTVSVYSGGIAPTGTNLTTSDLNTAVQALGVTSAQFGALGTSTLSALTAGAAKRVWLQGPEMIEAHYYDFIANELVAKWHVRYYSTGDLRIRVIAENGVLGNDGNNTNDESYIPTITISGSVVYNNGGTPLTHEDRSGWSHTSWVGITDPVTTVAHDTNYLQESRLVPNYWKTNPSEATLDSLTTTYTPLGLADLRTEMGAAGYHPEIGLLPNWNALYINSGGDSRAFKSTLANTEALNTHAIIWNNGTTYDTIALTDYGNWTYNGSGGTGTTSLDAGAPTWSTSHQPSEGYLSYLITGDYYYLQTMKNQAVTCYLAIGAAYNMYGEGTTGGTSRSFRGAEQGRSVAWILRNVGQAAAIAPADSSVDALKEWLRKGIGEFEAIRTAASISGYSNVDVGNSLGYFYAYDWVPSIDIAGGSCTYCGLQPWMYDFWSMSLGLLSDIEPLADVDMVTLNSHRDAMYALTIARLGSGGTSAFCFTKAADQAIALTQNSSTRSDFSTWMSTWGDVYYYNYGTTTCNNTLSNEGGSSSEPNVASTGYWGNLLPAIAYAVEDGATGAADAWARLTGADNWNEVETAGFENTPIWGIYPRSIGTPTPPTPVGGGRIGWGGVGRMRYSPAASGRLIIGQ